LLTDAKNGVIHYTLDGKEPTKKSPVYRETLTLTGPMLLTAVVMTEDGVQSLPITAVFRKAKHGIVLNTKYSPSYTAGGDLALIDGAKGSNDFKDGKWQGYEGVDVDAVVDLGSVKPIKIISTSFIENQESWVFMPQYVECSVSTDGREYRSITKLNNDPPVKQTDVLMRSFEFPAQDITARFVRLHAKSLGVCPPWHAGAGGKAWLFVDEITIE